MSTKNAAIELRHASIDDLSLLMFWDAQPHLIAADPNSDWNWKEELAQTPPWREQLIAELEKEPIGFVQIIDPAEEETHYWGQVEKNLRAIDIWIGLEKNLRKGYGTIMMSLALKRCFANPNVTAVLIDPLDNNIRAHRFYEYMGFVFLEQRSFDEDDCFVYRLLRSDWEKKQEHKH